MRDDLLRFRYRYLPTHWFGELLEKKWTETAIPAIAFVLVVLASGALLPSFYTITALADTLRQGCEVGFVVLGLGIVIIVGGIDLSVGSIFALTNFAALMFMHVLGWPVWAAVPGTLVVGALLGLINGVLIGYLKLRAFLTTLITLIIFRSVYEILTLKYSTAIAMSLPDSDIWDVMGSGTLLGLPYIAWAFLLIAIGTHILLTRTRVGWHLMAVGGSRRSAYNSGLPVRSLVTLCYMGSGVFCAIGGLFFASRLATAGTNIGVGMEVVALTAAVLGGISLGGGRGSVAKATLGAGVVLLVSNGLTALAVPGGGTRMVLASILVAAAAIDVRWMKNRHRIINKAYVSPNFHEMPPAPDCRPGAKTVWAANDKLLQVSLIGLGQVEAPEDVILDQDDNLYTGTRHGDIVRFFAPDYKRMETFAHIGGQPLGMAFDKNWNLYVCVGGMGLYRVLPNGTVEMATVQTGRSVLAVRDDSRLRLADDLDIADDGRVFFSEATNRYDMHDWPVDGLEGRGNGRILCYDPRDGTTQTVLRGLIFANGISMHQDGESLFFAETWGCTVKRFWFDGPRKGAVETILEGLPGYPDNINLASDGNYWLALAGMRAPAYDLAMRMPGFRRRMANQVPQDEWLCPNINAGCVVKFSETGQILETLWDIDGVNHPLLTSMREHKGKLFLGGISNNRIGCYELKDADTTFSQYEHRWKKAS